MDKRLKKGFVIGSIAFFLLIISTLTLNSIIKNKLKKGIDNFSKTIKIEFQAIDVNSLTGSIRLIDPKILIYGNTSNNLNVEIELKELSIKNLSYWDYCFNDKIHVEHILFDQPKIIYNRDSLLSLKSSPNSFKDSFTKTIEIGTIQMVNGYLKVFNSANDSLILKSDEINFKVQDVAIKKSSLRHKSPVTFQNYHLTYNNLFYKLSDYENLVIKHANFTTQLYSVKSVSIKTKYSKEALSRHISVERDYFDFTIDSVWVKNQDFGIKNDSLFYFRSNHVEFYQPKLDIYRDKLIADDLIYKPLYSKVLRGLNLDITLDNVFLNNGSIVYTEKVNEYTKGGRLEFSNLNAEINNLSNTYNLGDNNTSAHINAVFMQNTPLKISWDFDVMDINDEFIFKAEIGALDVNHMNQFMEPNLNVRLNGKINKNYFTINGNDLTSRVDLKLQYDDFDIVILKKRSNEKNKLLSGLINLFVSKNSKNKSNEFRHGHGTDIERDRTKSVFNYLWLNIKAGLLNAMTGDGEKK